MSDENEKKRRRDMAHGLHTAALMVLCTFAIAALGFVLWWSMRLASAVCAPADRPSLVSTRSAAPRRKKKRRRGCLWLWVTDGCVRCEQTISILREHSCKHKVLRGGVDAYMRSHVFGSLMHSWNPSDTRRTPIRGSYPIVVLERRTKGTAERFEMVGGYNEAVEYVRSVVLKT